MNVVYVCQVVDENNPTQAHAVNWIATLARKPQIENVRVIALRKGQFSLPGNVAVQSFERTNRFSTLVAFYKCLHEVAIRDVDCFFVSQGGPYPLLLLPYKAVFGKPIYQWKTHPYISSAMRMYAHLCDDKIFTATPQSFPMKLSKVAVIGHGVDPETFSRRDFPKEADLVTIGRVAPSKRLDYMVRALKRCNERYGRNYMFHIYGSCFEKDRGYKRSLERLVEELALSQNVVFRGSVLRSEVPDILCKHRLFLNFSQTALDKAVLEAMSCEVPVVSTNKCVAETLPNDLAGLLIAPHEDIERQAEIIEHVLSGGDSMRATYGKLLRDVVCENHSVERMFDRIVGEMEAAA